MKINDLIEIHVVYSIPALPSLTPTKEQQKEMNTDLKVKHAWLPAFVIDVVNDSYAYIQFQDPWDLKMKDLFISLIRPENNIRWRRVARKPYVTIDFDGTIVKHRYPYIGDPVPGAFETIRELQENDVRCILLTMREGEELQQAVNYCGLNGVVFWSVNYNPGQLSWAPDARKVYSMVHIDDTNCGSPLIYPKVVDRPYVDWSKIRTHLKEDYYLLKNNEYESVSH